jgi:hypothetical protein
VWTYLESNHIKTGGRGVSNFRIGNQGRTSRLTVIMTAGFISAASSAQAVIIYPYGGYEPAGATSRVFTDRTKQGEKQCVEIRVLNSGGRF